MSNKYFHPSIPPSSMIAAEMNAVVGTTFNWAKKFFPNSFDSPENDKLKSYDVDYVINSYGYREQEYDESYDQYV